MFIHPRGHYAPINPKLHLMGLRFGEGEGGGSEGDGGGEGGSESKYSAPATQADLDRIIESRLSRDRAANADKFKDYDELKAAKSKYDELLESQKSEHQKAIDAARGEAGTEITQKFLSKLVHSEVKSVASALGFNDPSDALQALGGELPVKGDEPDTEAIKKAIEKLAADKPYLVAEPRTGKPRTRPRPAEGEKDNTPAGGTGGAAAALRQLALSRKGQ